MDLEKLQKEKRKAESKGNLKEVADLCSRIGELHYRHGNYEDAMAEYLTELQLFEVSKEWLEVAVAHRWIGECLVELGDCERALEHQKQYLDIAIECNSTLEQQRAYATIGRVHFQHAQQSHDKAVDHLVAEAESAFKQSLNLVGKLSDDIPELEIAEMKSRLLMNLGLVCDFRNDIKGCSDYFRIAIQIAEKHKLFEDMYRCQYNLSGIYQKLGNLSQALRFTDMAVTCAAVKMKDKVAEKEGLVLKIKLLLQLQDFNAAKISLRKILKMKVSTDETEAILLKDMLRNVRKIIHLTEQLKEIRVHDLKSLYHMYEKIGDLATELHCHELGLEYYLKMESCATQLGLDDSYFIPIYVSIAETYNDLGQFKSAISYFQKELRCRGNDFGQICRTWLTIANIQDRNNEEFCQVKTSLESALQNAEKAGSWKLQALVLLSMKDFQIKFRDEDGQQLTEDMLKKLCIEQNLDLQEISQHLGDDNDDAGTQNIRERDIEDDESDSSDTDYCSENEEAFMKMKPSLMKLNEKGETPLHRACITGNFARVKALVEQGHPINPRDYCGWLPLHEAANFGFLEIVDYLIDKGARICDRGGDRCGGITPLHDACSCGNVRVIELLVNRGAPLDAKDDEGNTPLDSLIRYRIRSQEILTASELSDIEAMEKLLDEKMKDMQLPVFGRTVTTEPSSTSTYLHSPALIPVDELIGDDWLVDDTITQKENAVGIHRSFRHHSQSQRKETKRKMARNLKECMPKKVKRKIAVDDSSDNYGCSLDLLDNSSSVLFGKHRNEEIGLLQIIETSDASNCAENMTGNVQYLFTQSSEKECNGSSCKVSSKALCIKVFVENKQIRVPICQSDEMLTVLWLAEEAASHFYQLYGLKPLLSLSLQDGTKLEPNSLVSSFFLNCTELLGSVTGWNYQSLHTHYENLCSLLNCTMFANIKFQFQYLEETRSINLSGLNLCQQHIIPVSRALQYQTSLKELNLHGNRLEDEGIGHLWEVINTLPNLTLLNISSNGLSLLALQNLVTCLEKSQEKGIRLLQHLETFDLSCNNFGDASALSFAQCIFSFPNLTSLCISSCCLTYRFFEHGQRFLVDAGQGSNLRNFNISYNMIGSTGVELLLRSLNVCKLESLDLSNAVTFSQGCQLLKHLYTYLAFENSFLRELKLDGCHLKPEYIPELCRVVTGCRGLCSLAVSSNPLLRNINFEKLVTSAIKSQVKDLVFENCSMLSPLESSFLNVLNLKMCSIYPFEKVIFSCKNLSTLDKDNLNEIWLSHWSTRSICTFSSNYINMTVADLI